MDNLQPLSPAWFDALGEKAYIDAYEHNTDVIRLAVSEALEWAAGVVDVNSDSVARVMIRVKAEEVLNKHQETGQ